MNERPASTSAWAVVLAGGVGSRFWPASTPARPKQLLPLAGGRPLLAAAWERAEAIADPGKVRILAPPHLVRPILEALPDADEAAVWVEPKAKGTAPALARAAWEIESREPGAVMTALHADHVIEPLDGFVRTVARAADIARCRGKLVCIAREPDRAETGYGYIEPGRALEPDGSGKSGPTRAAARPPAAFMVRRFHEKPEPKVAERYLRAGHLWNTGIFVWLAATFLEEVRRCAPELGSAMSLLEEGVEEGAEDRSRAAAFFRKAPSCVVDRAVLERSARVAAVSGDFAWDDVGAWEALARTGPQDERGNVVRGEATVVDGSENIVFSDGGRVVVQGTDRLLVVRSGETTLVMPRDAASEIKLLLERIGERT